jgi:hypothetical protein
MKGFSRFLWTFFVASVAFSALAACGGGGGGGGGGTNPGFTGVQTLAAIDDTNAEQLALDAYNGGSLTDSLGNIPGLLSVGGGQVQPLAPLGRVLFDSLPELDFGPPTVKPLAVQTIDGTCGGSATANITEGQTSASGSIVFDNYCDAGVTLSGSVSLSATLNTSTNVVSISMSFIGLTSGGGSISGTVSMSEDLDDPNAAMHMSMNIVLTDALDQTYWVDHYTMTITPGGTVDAVLFSGTYHDFDAGHVVITSDSLQVDSFTGIPESGTLHFAGANGTYADLTATGGGGYNLVWNGTLPVTGTF